MSTIKSNQDNNTNEELHDPFSFYNTDNIGDKIKKLRQSLKLTGKELADKIGVSKVAISQYENNKTKPTIENLKKIADVGNVDLDYFLGTPKKVLSTEEEIMEFLDQESLKVMRSNFMRADSTLRAKLLLEIVPMFSPDDIQLTLFLLSQSIADADIAKINVKFKFD